MEPARISAEAQGAARIWDARSSLRLNSPPPPPREGSSFGGGGEFQNASLRAASDALIATAVVNPYRGRIARLTAHFLCLDEKPLKVSVFYAGQALVADQKIPVDVVPDGSAVCFSEW